MGRSLPSAQILGSGLRGRPQRLSGDRVVPSEGLVQMRARLLRAPRLPGPQGPSASPTHPPPRPRPGVQPLSLRRDLTSPMCEAPVPLQRPPHLSNRCPLTEKNSCLAEGGREKGSFEAPLGHLCEYSAPPSKVSQGLKPTESQGQHTVGA